MEKNIIFQKEKESFIKASILWIMDNGFIRRTIYQKEIKFKVSNKVINNVKQIYYKNNLNSLPDNYVMQPDEKDFKVREPNQRRTIIIFHFDEEKEKKITFWDDGNPNPLERIPNKKVKPIFEEIFEYVKKIRDSTGEKSDFLR